MNKITATLIITGLAALLSCNRTDFSNPEEVIKSYRTLSDENKNEKIYEEFLSSKSKWFVTRDEFIKTRSVLDSTLKLTTLLERKVSSFPIDINNPNYRRCKVDEKYIFKKDTVYDRYYYSLINENGKWKVIWTGTLFPFAYKKYNEGNYSEARETLEKIIKIDPFCGNAYDQLSWCYQRDHSLTRSKWENGMVKNAKYALTLEDDNSDHYNTLAVYYSEIGNYDLAIQNSETGISYCQNKEEKAIFYSNLVGYYSKKEKFEKAEEYIKKSIEINPKNAFVWFKYGELMQRQAKIDKATKYFEIALKEDKMENALQGKLFYYYSDCSFNLGKCEIAKEYVIKALNIEPNNHTYQALYNKMKDCDAKTQ